MQQPSMPGVRSDDAVVDAVRSGDEQVFRMLVERHQTTMLRIARGFVATAEAAEDVVQETWLGMLSGIDGFEHRSSLKTWIYRILVNRAQSRGQRDARSRPFSSFGDERSDEGVAPVVDPGRFIASGEWTGLWSQPPAHHSIPEQHVLDGEARAVLLGAVEHLPATQRTVISLRDIEGLSSIEVCDLLSISEVNQRVLLHRARSRVRAVLEEYFDARTRM